MESNTGYIEKYKCNVTKEIKDTNEDVQYLISFLSRY